MKTFRLVVVAAVIVASALSGACGESQGSTSTGGQTSIGTQGGKVGVSGSSASGGAAAGGAAGGMGGPSGGHAAGGNSALGQGGAALGTGGSSGSGMTGAGGAAGTTGTAGETSAGGSVGQSGAGGAAAGSAGAGGASESACPVGCSTTPSASCDNGNVVWTCSLGYDYQEFKNGGCRDLATDLQRFCCPPEFHEGCKPCAQETTLEGCEARSDCHAVFQDPGTCGCAAVGCCARFARCADRPRAACSGSVTCTSAKPLCEAPAFYVSYANGCYEGCVAAKDCEP